MDPISTARLADTAPKTPTKANPGGTAASQAKPTPFNKGSASQALCNTLGRISDVEESFRADLDAHASAELLEDFLLFLLSCCTQEKERTALKEKLDKLMEISLLLCSSPTPCSRPKPVAKRHPRTVKGRTDKEELESLKTDPACDNTVPLRSDWRDRLEEYALASKEADRYAPFICLANSILQGLHDEQVRAKLKDIHLARDDDDESYPHIIFQQNDPKTISVEYIGVSGEALAEDVGRKPDVVVLSLRDALTTHIAESGSIQPLPNAADWKDQYMSHMTAATKEPTHAPSFPQVKMCFEFKKKTKEGAKKYGPRVPSTCEKKDKPADVTPQTWGPSKATFKAGFGAELKSSISTTTHLSSSMHEHRNSSGQSKRPLGEDGEGDSKGGSNSGKKPKLTKKAFKDLPGPIQSAIYAGGKLSSSLAADHTLNAVVEDTTIYLWWYDHGGAIQSHGLDFFQDFPYLVALLTILDHFNDADWGSHPAFQEAEPSDEGTLAYDLTLKGEGPAASETVFRLDFRPTERNSAYSLFGRGTSVLPVTSSAVNPLQEMTSLENVKMVAKMYYPETARMDESGLLKVAHSMAGSKLDPDGYIQGHLLLLLASNSWEDRYVKQMNTLFNAKRLKRVSRCFRVLVFVKIYPIWELRGDEFIRALWDCMCCHYSLARNGVLHRDISVDNLMYFRKPNGEVAGVLNDFDLAIVIGFSRKSYEKTGTIPFMAHQLLLSMKDNVPRPHIYEYDFESFYYVTIWVTCSYDGPHVVNKTIFAEWLDVPNYADVARAKRGFTKDMSKIRLTRAHGGIRSLLRPFADELDICFGKQTDRERVEARSERIITSWKERDPKLKEKDALKAQKQLDDLNASLVWPHNLAHMETIFTAIKSHFDEHFFGEEDAPTSSPTSPSTSPTSASHAPGEQVNLSLAEDSCSSTAVRHIDAQSVPEDTDGASDQVLADGDPALSKSLLNVATSLFATPAVDEAAEDEDSEAGLPLDLPTSEQETGIEQDLEKIAVAEIMDNDSIVRRAGDASRKFWQITLGNPSSDWHSLAVFLRETHHSLFSSCQPAPSSVAVH